VSTLLWDIEPCNHLVTGAATVTAAVTHCLVARLSLHHEVMALRHEYIVSAAIASAKQTGKAGVSTDWRLVHHEKQCQHASTAPCIT
jgi:hypothetical protein